MNKPVKETNDREFHLGNLTTKDETAQTKSSRRGAGSSDLTGKTRPQIESVLRNKDRPELLDLIFELVTVEPYLSVSQLARLRKVSRDTILDKIRKGEIPRAHRLGEHGLRIPLSAVAQWDKNTQITGCGSEGGAE
jgi:excisionase family DNA binding protein